MEWQDNFSVNIREIDQQHQKLVGMINALHEAMLAHKGSEAHKTIINGMVDYASVHFKTEEDYMARFGFPGSAAHQLEHKGFTEKALELKERASRDGFILTLEILNFLRDWLQHHILDTDKRYSTFFNERGLA
jgi:hemerythrin-like metal-binding protein